MHRRGETCCHEPKKLEWESSFTKSFELREAGIFGTAELELKPENWRCQDWNGAT